MSHWNYRLGVHKDGFIEIVEMYYDENGEPWLYCDATVGGMDLKETQEAYTWLARAFEKPIVDLSTLDQKPENV